MPPPANPEASAAVHPCLKTHGKEVARLHLFDWIVLLLLVATTGALGLVQPFHRFVAQDMMSDLRYPMKGSTVPDWAVPVIASLCRWFSSSEYTSRGKTSMTCITLSLASCFPFL
ncbi:hypothetical protein ACQJBY_065190 [Aegilops geniculata]